ncbi:MAG: 4Fe-4S dicluster domain-containing protein [Ruminococcaceae bacterium]|nr:4Fe-4S dicluster domain-containing protein [Oscillospiraceae bacterium]
MQILISLLILGGLGLLFGALLGYASKVFHVESDERIDKIVSCLPGANCGGCGFAGCSNFAASVVSGQAQYSGCPVCNSTQREQIAEIMGVTAGEEEKMSAVVLCSGSASVAEEKYTYKGINDCNAAMRLGGGQKKCEYACIGLGTCVSVCKFGAISIKDGVAVIDSEKCTACGMCVNACPKHVIKLLPEKAERIVLCSSKQKGAAVTKSCRVGCIGCGLCAKVCPSEAITIQDNLAVIDSEKCTNCGACKEKCPRGIIA